MTTNTEISSEFLGGRIEAAMKAKGVKPTRLAAELDVSESTLRRFIDGKTEPSYRQVLRLSAFLGYPIEWFAGAKTKGEVVA